MDAIGQERCPTPEGRPDPTERVAQPAAEEIATDGSVTRGVRFADRREYTRDVETHGAAAAADLLARYRSLVRGAVARHRGAEIKTEGDSFYVVFSSVSAAVQCGLAIVAEARSPMPETEAARTEPIAVGVGVHAGETIETPEGYVGGPVNIAARICALARPGEVLVSDTVRALTATVLPVTFTPLGRRQLKGVRELLALYRVAPADPAASARAAARGRRLLVARGAAVVLVVAVLAAGAYWWQSRPAAGLPPGPLSIGVLAPLSGEGSDVGQAIVNAVKLAIDDAKATGLPGASQLVPDLRDEGAADQQNAAVDASRAWAADGRVIAVVGPVESAHGKAVIPLTNEAGLLTCSPAATDAALTKLGLGALQLRPRFPNRIAFVRLATSEDVEAPAAASFVFDDLQVRAVLAVDDASPASRVLADRFATSFDALEPAIAASGAASFRRTLNPGATDFAAVFAPVFKEGTGPGSRGRPAAAVYYAGEPKSGAAELKRALDAALAQGHVPRYPFIGWHGLLDGSGAVSGSFIQRAAAQASLSYATALSIPPARADFDVRYRTTFGRAPDKYAGAAYACIQVILEAVRDAAQRALDVSQLREAVRAYATDTTHRFDTVLGTVGFDANGDSVHQFVSFYKVNTAALGGKGDWVFVKQQDFEAASSTLSPSPGSSSSP